MTHNSRWIASGLSVKVVQLMAGHASATMTLDRCGHLCPDDLDVAAARLAGSGAAVRADAGLTPSGEPAEASESG
jgi:hypothetical protein